MLVSNSPPWTAPEPGGLFALRALAGRELAALLDEERDRLGVALLEVPAATPGEFDLAFIGPGGEALQWWDRVPPPYGGFTRAARRAPRPDR